MYFCYIITSYNAYNVFKTSKMFFAVFFLLCFKFWYFYSLLLAFNFYKCACIFYLLSTHHPAGVKDGLNEFDRLN